MLKSILELSGLGHLHGHNRNSRSCKEFCAEANVLDNPMDDSGVIILAVVPAIVSGTPCPRIAQ